MQKIYLTNRRFQDQQGLTLVEILVALTLGLLVTLTVLQIFISSKQGFRIQGQSSLMQESGNYALELLSKYIRQTGYRSDLTSQKNPAFASTDQIQGMCDQEDENFASGQIIFGVDGGGPNQSDCIIIRYHGSDEGSMTDCFGSNKDSSNAIINEKQTIVNSFFISTDTDNNNVLGLSCRSKVFNFEGGLNESTERQGFVPGIQNIKILYGVNNTGQLQTGVQEYRTADKVTNWNTVVSVRIALLIVSDEKIADQPQPYIFPPWDNSKTTPTDYYLRRVVTTTINLRNQSQSFY